MAKKVIALILGIISFPLMMVLGEEIGVSIAFMAIGVYYLLSQFMLSRGNARRPF